MPFDLDDLNPPAKFFWLDEDGNETGEWVEFRIASDEDTDKMRREAGVKLAVEYKRVGKGGPQRFDYINTSEENLEKFTRLVNIHTIVSWYLLDKNGNEIECTPENRNRFIRESPMFSEWAADCLEKMRADVTIKKEEEVKNS